MSSERRLLRFLVRGALSAALACFVALPIVAGEPAVVASSPEPDGATRTGKERLAGKASDEQRVNDCKVPEELRGSGKRSAACGAVKAPPRPSE